MNASPAPTSPESSPSNRFPKGALIALLVLCLVAVGGVVFLIMRSNKSAPEVILAVTEAKSPEAAGLPALSVVDTIQNPSAEAVVGGRYKVRITDNAREGSSGIARIGGLVTFVQDTAKGDMAIIEVTRLKRSTADAALIERLSSAPAPSAPSSTPEQAAPSIPAAPAAAPQTGMPETRDSTPPARSGLVGQTLRGTVEAVGKEGDGIVKVNGKTVFIKGTSVGQHIEFKVTDERARIAFGELLQVLPKPEKPAEVPATAPEAVPAAATPASGPEPAPATPAVEPAAAPRSPMPAIGSEHVVTVTEKDRRNPDKNGVARINRLVVFVPDTQPGDRVRIRIVEHMPRAVRAELIERLPAETPAPTPPAS
ncbi:MAG: TRAM domain-containing protein [Kiritimatiellae bacterium]|nr:TRAM domain-containing protein [Kiritimatiellia bacterium]